MKMRAIILCAAFMLGLIPANDSAVAEPAPYNSPLSELRSRLPADARMINMPGIANWTVNGTTDTETVSAPTVAGGKAISVHVPRSLGNSWDIAVVAPITEPILRGDTIFLAVQIRAAKADNEAQSGVIAASKIEESAGAYTAIADAAAQVSSEWTTLYSAGVSAKDYKVGDTHITVHLGSARQTIEIGNAYAFNLGPNVDLASLPRLKVTYPGREADAPWRAAAQARIDAIRKADLTIRVVDASGKPLSGAKVDIEMKSHAFHFGSFVGHDITKDDADTQKLRETFPKLFNTATSPLYWADWGWQSDKMRAGYVASMKYLADNKIAWRGHPLIYPGENFVPTKLKALANDPAAYTRAVLEHVREVSKIAGTYKPFAFDVINEPRDGKYTTDRTGIDGIAEAFRIAHAAAPDAHLFVNDYGIISGGGRNVANVAFYHEYLTRLKAAGAPLSGIGMQGHFGALLTDPVRVYKIFEDFARYNVPLQITEFDIDTTDEEAQADYTRDLLTIAFSHPSMEAFITWGWWEGDHWRPNGAMLRKDWSPKPNYHAWRKLVFSDWWTKKQSVSGADGKASTRGFLGDYRVRVTVGKDTEEQSISLPKAGTTVQFTM